jgi:hypothetical protein
MCGRSWRRSVSGTGGGTIPTGCGYCFGHRPPIRGRRARRYLLRFAIRSDAESELVRGWLGDLCWRTRVARAPTQVESLYGGVMSKFRLAVCTGFAASALLLIPAGSASAHVHGITPLRCAPANDNAGAIQGFAHSADAAGLTGVIPVTKGGNVVIGGEGFNAAVCDDFVPEPE